MGRDGSTEIGGATRDLNLVVRAGGAKRKGTVTGAFRGSNLTA